MTNENMNGDLINRSELIKTIKLKLNYASATAFVKTINKIRPVDLVYMIFDIIDNAPSNENFGKWIFHKDFNDSIKYGCNQCGNLANIPSNFCPNCGAKMEKGAES